MVIIWDTASDERRKYYDGTFVSRFGEVDGVRRFQIKHQPRAAPGEDRWEARDLLDPEPEFYGTYKECTEWCWMCG